jgi:hypothetical protein
MNGSDVAERLGLVGGASVPEVLNFAYRADDEEDPGVYEGFEFAEDAVVAERAYFVECADVGECPLAAERVEVAGVVEHKRVKSHNVSI